MSRESCEKNKDALSHEFWMKVALYANAYWKGHFSADTVKKTAREYASVFQSEKNKEVPTDPVIVTLLENLTEDAQNGDSEAEAFLYEIQNAASWNPSVRKQITKANVKSRKE